MINRRNDSAKAARSDDYLTPPELLGDLGYFDLDPCCPPDMPWKTAEYMVRQRGDLVEDGLSLAWKGRVFCNPPYSQIMPWVKKFVEHGQGILLVPAKSTDTKWAQLALSACTATMFLAGRLLFYRPDGRVTDGKWMPNMLVAIGRHNEEVLIKLRPKWPGTVMRHS